MSDYVAAFREWSIKAWWRAHFSGVDRREAWGYGVWSAMGIVLAVPELWAAFGKNVPWPTISGTVGHLEYEWSPTAIIVVGLIVFAAFHAVRYALPQTAPQGLERTEQGRLTKKPAPDLQELPLYPYFAGAIIAVIAGSLITVNVTDDRWFLAYVLYGLIALFWIVGPSIAAYVFAKDVPFPTLFRTIANLERRLHVVAMLVLVGLAILMLHLALYPWPDISHILQNKPPTTHSP